MRLLHFVLASGVFKLTQIRIVPSQVATATQKQSGCAMATLEGEQIVYQPPLVLVDTKTGTTIALTDEQRKTLSTKLSERNMQLHRFEVSVESTIVCIRDTQTDLRFIKPTKGDVAASITRLFCDVISVVGKLPRTQ
jgi:hypothetical protein